MSDFFNDLMESVTQMDEILRGERAPSREVLTMTTLKEVRAASGLSQAKFAAVIDVPLCTLRNWEQGRREPPGPAKVLLRAIRNDPKNVLRAAMREGAEG